MAEVATAFRFAWERAFRDATGLRTSDKAVGYALATWASKDGGNIFPGDERIGIAAGLSTRSVQDARARLVSAGWLTVARRGNGRAGLAATYSISLPKTTPAPEAASGIGEAEHRKETTPAPEVDTSAPDGNDASTGSSFRPTDQVTDHLTTHLSETGGGDISGPAWDAAERLFAEAQASASASASAPEVESKRKTPAIDAWATAEQAPSAEVVKEKEEVKEETLQIDAWSLARTAPLQSVSAEPMEDVREVVKLATSPACQLSKPSDLQPSGEGF